MIIYQDRLGTNVQKNQKRTPIVCVQAARQHLRIVGVRSQHRLRNGRQLQCERSGWGEREKQPFWHDFLYKPNVCQDRLGTNMGKVDKKANRFL
jgi:hypothetical protein